MMTILQNALGETCAAQLAVTAPHHAAYCAQHGYAFHACHHGAPLGFKPYWSKLPMWLSWLLGARDGDTAIGMDTDAVIVRPSDSLDVLPAGADLGLVQGALGSSRWLNTGVIFLRKQGDALQRFFQRVLNIGPLSDGLAGEQMAINRLLNSPDAGVTLAVLSTRFNSYRFAPCDAPTIRAFHGEKNKQKIIESLQQHTR